MKKLLAFCLALATGVAFGQQTISSNVVRNASTVGGTYLTDALNTLNTSKGSGTVTGFSAGNLSPLFSTSVATSTTTPALTFSLSGASAGTIFGNLTGSPGAPSYTAASSIPLSAFSSAIGLTGYLYGNGSSATTASTTIPTTALSGTLQSAQFPALTGDCTTTAGSLATSCTKTGGVAFGTAATKNTGNSVIDPGTGALEQVLPWQTAVTGASKAWAVADFYRAQKRSNGGSAMSDTLACGTVNGQQIVIANDDTAGTDTITVSGCNFVNATGGAGATTYGLLFGRRTQFVWDGTTSVWRFNTNNNNLVKNTGTPVTGHIATYADTSGLLITDGGTAVNSVTNSDGTLTISPTTGAVVASRSAITGGVTIASGSNMATVVTNANLTGPVTSVGNATTITPTITAGGPTGSATVAPVITYNAAGQLTAVTSATITPAVGSITGLGTGVSTALGTNVGSAGSFVVNGGALGTPSSGTLTNATGLPIGSGVSGLGTGVTTALGTNLGTAGAFVVNGGTLGTPSSGTLTNATGLPLTTGVTGQLPNANLLNPSTTVNGQTCTLGSTCTAIQMAASGTTPNANGATITGNSLSLQTSNASFAGLQSAANYSRDVGHVDAFADFNIVGDHKVAFEITASGTQVVATAGNATINCPNACATTPFASTDVGKRITIRGAGTNGATYVGTISAFNSTTSVNVTPNPATTVTATTSVPYAVQWGTDNTTGCNNLVSYVNGLSYPGVVVYFPPSATNRYACPVPLLFTNGAILEGQGSPANQDAGNYAKAGGTYLVWWGTTNDGGTAFNGFVQFSAIPANNQMLNAAGLHDIGIDCRNGDQNPCATALRLVDVLGFDVRNFFVIDPLNAINLATANMGSVTASTGRGLMSNIGARQLDNTNTPQSNVSTAVSLTPTTIAAGSTGQVMTAAGSQSVSVAAANGFFTPGYFWFTATNGSVYYMNCAGGGGTTTLTGCSVSTDAATENPTLLTGANIVQASPNNGPSLLTEGTTTTNTNLYTFEQGRWSYGTNYGPANFEFHNADSANFLQMVMNGGNSTNDGLINRVRRPGVRFAGSIVSAATTSRNIHFYDGDPGGPSGGGVVAIGVNTAGTGLLTAVSGPNFWDRYQLGNGAPVPVVEGVTASATQAPVGPIFEYTTNGGLTAYQIAGSFVNGTNNSLASTAATEVVIPGSLVKLPPQWAQAGAAIQWHVVMSKTAAGTDTHTYKIHYGTTGATGTDTAVLATPAGGAGTAAIDQQELEFKLSFPTVGASVTPLGTFFRTGKLQAAGTGYGTPLATTAPTMSAVNTTTAQVYAYLAITTSATGETNTIVSTDKKILQAMPSN